METTAALADDTLEAPLLGDAQQSQPKRSNRACRHAWRFTSGRGRTSRPLNASRSNRPQVDSARPGTTHVQSGEVRSAVGIAGRNLAVEHCRSGWQLAAVARLNGSGQ